MLNNEELKAVLEACPAERVTEDFLKSQIKDTEFSVQGTLTMCRIVVKNGFSFVGESACVDPANYNKEAGETISYSRAFDKMWPCYGFLLAEVRLHRASKAAEAAAAAVPGDGAAATA